MIEIDKIYYINLDKRKDRQDFMETQLKEFPFEFERFSASFVERNDLLDKDGKYHSFYLRCSPNDKLNFKNAIETGNKFTNVRGLIGACISHTLLLKKIAKENSNKCTLILEDDCVIKTGWYENLCKLVNDELEWDVIRCVWGQTRRHYIKHWSRDHSENKNISKKTTDIYGGAHFTLVNKNSKHKVYNHFLNEYLLTPDGPYGTTQLNVYSVKLKNCVDYVRTNSDWISDCNPIYEH